jgi:ferritin-like metal-binding protein YciE
MISKIVPADSVYHTCRYICNKPGAEVLATDGVREYDFKLMAEDFTRQQQLRPGKQKAFFHGILSFHPSEKPSNETLMAIASQYLQRLGIVNTQYSIVKHTDKSHLHLHVVANMVDNNGNVIRDNFTGLRGKKVAQQLTQEYKLIPAIKKDLALTNLENMNEHEVARYKIYMAIAENLPHCNSMEILVNRLKQQSIDTQFKYKGQTQEIQGVSFKTGNYSFKGSQVDRKFSFAGLQKAFAQGIKEDVENVMGVKEDLNQPKDGRQVFRKIHAASKRNSQKADPNSAGLEKDGELLKQMNKALEDLLKPEPADQYLPYELTQEGYRRKKQAHRHKR